MLTRPQVQRYAAESGLRDLMIAEKEVILTYLLQQAPDQPPRDTDRRDGSAGAMRTELFPALALHARGNHLPGVARDHRRESPRLLSAQQGARYL